MWPRETVYALYRGDEFVDVGTKRELAARRHVSAETIAHMASPVTHKRAAGHEGTRVLAYRIEMGDDEDAI